MTAKYTEPCPVCGETMECKEYYEPRWLEEAYHSCPQGCYHFEFAYGSTRITVGDEEFGHWYGDTIEETSKFQINVDSAVRRAKERRSNVHTDAAVHGAI